MVSKKQSSSKTKDAVDQQPQIITPAQTKLHKCSFSSWRPSAINAMSYNDDLGYVAVGRDDSTVEIWSLEKNFFLLNTLGGSKFDSPILNVAWLKSSKDNSVLLSVTENKLTLWDINTFTIIKELGTIGNIKAASFNSTLNLLSVLTNDCVQLYSYDGETIQYQSSFPKISNSIPTFITWANDHKTILCGTSNQLVVFKLESMRSILNVSTEYITSIGVISDKHVACGFNNGFLSIIDFEFGSVVQEFRNLHAPIRAIQATQSGDRIFVGGDEANIVSYQYVNGRWAPNGQHKRDSHDIRCMTMVGSMLVSGGVSTKIIFYQSETFSNLLGASFAKHPQYPKNNFAVTQTNPILLIESSKTSIHLWSLGEPDSTTLSDEIQPNGTYLALSKKTKKLLQFESKSPLFIESVDISSDGKYFTYSNRQNSFLYSIDTNSETNQISIKKIQLPEQLNNSCIAKFTKDSLNIVFASNSDQVYIYNIQQQTVTITKSTNANNNENDDSNAAPKPIQIEIDSFGQYCALIDSMKQVIVFDIANPTTTTPYKLPNSNSIPTKLFFHPQFPILYTYSSFSLTGFDVRQLKMVSCIDSTNQPVHFITNNPNDQNELLLWSRNSLSKVSKMEVTGYVNSDAVFEETIFAAQSQNDIVVVDLSYNEQVLPSLPEAIKTKKFGGQ
ncbi:hypothetical protein CYY_006167 [Polysphondylium violaceum]|uniref:WD40 repeat-containing protein n=1 Tax=Polysphondylium violaceum TaxID=133409 RepID=A0A8J4V676_9MYCE|nr:hypothetical protein CYY_006167 [Polysphondylium violaceum]